MAKAKRTVKGKNGCAKGQVKVTLGDLIAAACEAVGNNASKAAKLISSPEIQNAMDKRIVFV